MNLFQKVFDMVRRFALLPSFYLVKQVLPKCLFMSVLVQTSSHSSSCPSRTQSVLRIIPCSVCILLPDCISGPLALLYFCQPQPAPSLYLIFQSLPPLISASDGGHPPWHLVHSPRSSKDPFPPSLPFPI